MIVKRSKRFGLREGCWWITKGQAKKLCGDNPLPRPGYYVTVAQEPGVVTGHRGAGFPSTFSAEVHNVAGSYRVHDENLILGLHEVE